MYNDVSGCVINFVDDEKWKASKTNDELLGWSSEEPEFIFLRFRFLYFQARLFRLLLTIDAINPPPAFLHFL